MLILSKNNDDKGTQLEEVAQSMLSGRGYQNIRLNSVGSGGAEYDVTGEFVMPLAVNTRRVQVIGECKARKDPLNMTDWQKFMGKVYLESVKRGQEVTGLLIALSGFNSNVSSSYDDYREHKDNVELLGESQIEDFLKSEYAVCSLPTVVSSLSTFTTRIATSIELCYYQRACYWFVEFESDNYTVLNVNAQPVTGNNLQEIREMIEAAETSKSFVNLSEEAEALRKSVLVQKHILGRLMHSNGLSSVESLLQDAAFSDEEIDAATNLLADKGWLERHEQQIRFTSIDGDGYYSHIVDMLRFWLNGEALVSTLYDGIESEFYDRHINESLLSRISEIQGNLPFEEEQASKIVRILKLSPQALNRALHPYDFITNGRAGQNLQHDEPVNAIHRDLFYAYITSGFVQDYRNPHMGRYYGGSKGIVELEQHQGVVAKSLQGIDFDIEWRSRHSIRPSNVQGGFIHLMVMHNHPEPWETTEASLRTDIAWEQF